MGAIFFALHRHLLNYARMNQQPLVGSTRKDDPGGSHRVVSVPIRRRGQRVVGFVAFFAPPSAPAFGVRALRIAEWVARRICDLLDQRYDANTGLPTLSHRLRDLVALMGDLGLPGSVVEMVDDAAQKSGYFEGRKHHQEYQELLLSAHYKKGEVGCIDCHSPHATKKEARKDPKKTCAKCHDASYTYEKYMPGTGRTADNLFVRTHTFVKENADRKGGPTATGTPEYRKK
mgnify:CR=1 FL=1